MEWADFVHLVRTSEQDSAENSSAYRRSVAAFAALVQRQLPGLKRRIALTQYMQGFGVLSFLLCALSMFALFLEAQAAGKLLFGASILTLALSLVLSLVEVLISTEALSVVVQDLEDARRPPQA